jgi:hypothetical protein
MSEKPKPTQGQAKSIQRFKELFENEVFNHELEKILASQNKSKRLFKFAQKYGLDMEFGSPFLDYVSEKKLPKETEISFYDSDVCMVIDEVDELLYPEEGHPKYKALPDKKLEINLYPIHICISPRATKRDVLDFISKRWFYIRDMLDTYLDFDEKPKIVRSKPKAERDQFIWENQNLSASKVADLLNKKYPDETLTYSDVNAILYYLRKRRKSKIV